MGTALTLRLAHPSLLRDHILRESGAEALFVPGYADVPAGAPVDVTVQFPAEAFKLRGRVLWRRTRRGGAKASLQTGVGVAWLESQKEAVKRLYAYADAPKVSISRREAKRTSSTSIRVSFGSFFSLQRDYVHDLSLGGLRIASQRPPARVGEKVTLYLRTPRALTAIKLTAEVVWIHLEEFGVRFLEPSPKDRHRLSLLIERLA